MQIFDTQNLSSRRISRYLRVIRNRLAALLGVRSETKQSLYLDLYKTASLYDLSYWLQTLFSAGIATLGLALNSPAVIIGAMLISPLMGPIMSSGLALATGDLVLALRAGVKLLLSCMVAIVFSVLLVWLLPFREMTSEIAGRTQPNTLDLFVALFSGAVGSIALCREVKGVVTSIPGVAIAVALMPPLCVVGYGIGVAATVDVTLGLGVARGGGLLFLTNLVTITLASMFIFMAVQIDTAEVREFVRVWRREDPESAWVSELLKRWMMPDALRMIGSFPGRLLMILIPFILILIPLSQSLNQLKNDFSARQQGNRVELAVRELWKEHFGKTAQGESRSQIDQLASELIDDKLFIRMRVVTREPYSAVERSECERLIAARLGRPVDSVNLEFVEIPTTEADVSILARQLQQQPVTMSVAEMRSRFEQGIDNSLRGLRFPPSAHLLSRRIMTAINQPMQIQFNYLADADISPDAMSIITETVRDRLSDTSTVVRYERVPPTFGALDFARNNEDLQEGALEMLASACARLRLEPELHLRITARREKNELAEIADLRARAIRNHIDTTCREARDRVAVTTTEEFDRTASLRFSLKE